MAKKQVNKRSEEIDLDELLRQIGEPNLKILEGHLKNKANTDMHITATTIMFNGSTPYSKIMNPSNGLDVDYEKIPNKLHVPSQLANSTMNPNIAKPSQPTTTIGLVGLFNLGNTCFLNTAV